MSLEDYMPLRWAVEITAANQDIYVYETGDPANNIIATLTPGWYRIDGTGNLIGASDLIAEINTRLSLAVTALGLSNPIVMRMGLQGRVEHIGDSGDPISISWAASSFDRGLLGVKPATVSTDFDEDAPNWTEFPWGAGYQWSPGVLTTELPGMVRPLSASETKNKRRRPRRTKRAALDWGEGQISWNRIDTARMLDSRAADPLYAALVGRDEGDPDTYERWYRYQINGYEGVGPIPDTMAPFWIYTSADSSVAEVLGPYECILEESVPGLEGVKPGSYEQGLSTEMYRVLIKLWEE